MIPLAHLVLVAAALGVPQRGPVACPSDEHARQTLQVDKSWVVTCKAKRGDVLIAGVLAPQGAADPPRIAVAVVQDGVVARAALDLAGPEEVQIKKIPAEEWDVSVAFQTMGAERWIRVTAIGRAGEDEFTAQGVVSFFVLSGERLTHVWTGLGDRAETHFDACQMDTVTRFRLLAGRKLERRWRYSATFRDPGGMGEDLIKDLKKECVAHSPTVERFPLRLETPTGG